MKFTIEVEDFWLEEEEIADALLSHIKNSVVIKISESIKDRVEKEITTKLTETINEKLSLIIDSKLTDLIATETIVIDRADISITQHIKNVFQRHNGWNRPENQIESIAKAFGEELKLQYNNAFANRIVANMKTQGLLKDEVVQILLGGE